MYTITDYYYDHIYNISISKSGLDPTEIHVSWCPWLDHVLSCYPEFVYQGKGRAPPWSGEGSRTSVVGGSVAHLRGMGKGRASPWSGEGLRTSVVGGRVAHLRSRGKGRASP